MMEEIPTVYAQPATEDDLRANLPRLIQRCQHVSPSPWGMTQCALPIEHDERHAYSPSER